jgi:Na+-transporting NADH:ubiquinone oxidoreductase subunit NqrB
MKGAKLTTGIGCGLLLLSLLILGISVALPVATSGRTSWGEASWGIISGSFCSTISFLVFLVGAIWLFATRKKS